MKTTDNHSLTYARLRMCSRMRSRSPWLLHWLLLLLLLVGFTLPLPTYGQTKGTIREFTIGTSTQGRDITAVQIGDGLRKLVVVGDTHGGPEANTHQLALQLLEYFRSHPEQVPPEVRLYIIPTLNPDGLALDTRFNANGVDLNRNMNTNLDSCPENDWDAVVNGAYGVVSNTGGDFPDSEIESRLIRNFLLDASGAIFLHSNAGLVFPPYCEHSPSIRMAQIYAQASGYTYQRYWDKYMITGGMHDWAGSIGIAAIIPELISGVDSEFAPNLAGVRAVLEHAEEVLPLPADQVVGDTVVPALIWRYWRTHGGEQVFGVPIQPAYTTAKGVSQLFTNAQLEMHHARVDTPFYVQPAELGRIIYSHMHITEPQTEARGEQEQPIPAPVRNTVAPTEQQQPNINTNAEPESYTLYGAFLDYWHRRSGASVFGYPISEEFTTFAADGHLRAVQYFERGAFAYYPESGKVRPEPLGWQSYMVELSQAPWMTYQIR